MNYLDYFSIAIIVVGFLLGFKDGFVRKIIGLTGFALGVFLSIRFAPTIGGWFQSFMDIDVYLLEIIAGFSIFLLIIVLTSIIKRIVHPFDKVNNFINQLAGGISGAIQILFFLSALFFLLNIFSIPNKDDADSSLIYNTIKSILPHTINIINDYAPQTKDVIKEYIQEKDSL